MGPLERQRQLDACCQAFEEVWTHSGTPRIEDFLPKVADADRAELLRELLILELHYRRGDDGGHLDDSQICGLHSDLMPDIAEQLKLLRHSESGDAAMRHPPMHRSEHEPTIDHTPRSSGSRGLHIRCPHCSNPVELLADTPLQSITCRTCGSTFSLVDQEEQTCEAPTLKRIGRFDLVARVGVGGFGTVWKARDTELDRTVAVKIPRKGQLAREEIEQFFREARSAAQLRHPNIVPVHEVGRDEDTVFIVSDLIRGVSLSDWLSGAKPSAREVAEILVIVCDALQHAHQQGVIHRDLKPSNILLDDFGQPHLMDFGLAKREIGEVTMTVDGHVLGTPAYMSPEQAAGEAHWTDRRTDIYSMGVILFRMLTGELPFRGNAQMQIHQRLNEDAPDPRTLNSHLPRDLCIICSKCLERDPNRRFTTAKELGDEFGRFLRHEPILSRPVSRVERVLRWAKRNPALATAAALTAFLAIAGPTTAIVVTGLYQRERQLQSENNNLINRYRGDINDYKAQLVDVEEKLDVWEGRANPFEWVWPPQRGKPPRERMIKDALAHSTAALKQPLRDEKFGREASAKGYLGLAMLSEAAGKTTEAQAYYELAREQLETLRRQHPDEPRFTRAAANLAIRLGALSQPTAAAEELHHARTLLEDFAKSRATDAQIQIDWLEAELADAFETTGVSQMAQLSRVEKISQNVIRSMPNSPEELYKLACYLVRREPILEPPATSAPAAIPKSAPPSD